MMCPADGVEVKRLWYKKSMGLSVDDADACCMGGLDGWANATYWTAPVNTSSARCG